MPSKTKIKIDSKVNNDFPKGKKRSHYSENFEGKNLNDRTLKSLKKSENSLKVVGYSQDIQTRSYSNSPIKDKPADPNEELKSHTLIACSPILGYPQKGKNLSLDEDNSKNQKKRELSSSKKTIIPDFSQNLPGKKLCKLAQVSQDSNEEKLAVLSKCKTSQPKNLKFSNEKRKDSLSSTLHKDAEQLSSRLKLPIKLRKRSKKAARIAKQLDETQRPISQLPRNALVNSANKLPEPSVKQIKPKAPEKLKFNSNRSKPKLSAKALNSKSKKSSEENLLKEKGKVITGILKVKKTRFESYRQTSDSKEIFESKNTDSKSSTSLSESAEWVNIDCNKFVAGPSELVGEFLKKLGDNKQILNLKANSEESKRSSYFEQPSGSSYCDSINLVSDELPIVTEKKHKHVPPLQLMFLHNKMTSDSSRYCEQDAGIFESKDSFFKSLSSAESKFSGNRSARHVIRSKMLPGK